MSRRERIVCQCGGEITRPIPPKCPHCGAVITAVKPRLATRLVPLLVVGSMFAGLVAYLWWMAS